MPTKTTASKEHGGKGFVKFFNSLPPAEGPLVRFFQRKGGQTKYNADYFTVHGNDAIFVAETYYNTLSALRNLGSSDHSGAGLPSHTVSMALFSSILQDLLLVKRYRVEVYEQKSASNNWTLTKRGSPGNISDFEDDLAASLTSEHSHQSATTLAVLLDDKGDIVIGAAFVDMLTRTIYVAEFTDDEYMSNLESMLVQVGAKECLVHKNSASVAYRRLSTLLEMCDVLPTEKPKSTWKASGVEEDLEKLLGDSPKVHNHAELQMKNAMQCVSCLLRHFELLASEHNFQRFSLRLWDLKKFMRLDQCTLKALKLVPDKDRDRMNLFDHLNCCQTPMGARLLLSWVKQPLVDLEEIKERLDMVDLFYQNSTVRQLLKESFLCHLPDVSRIMRKLVRAKGAGLPDVLHVYQFVQRLRGITEMLRAEADQPEAHSALFETLQESYIVPLGELVSQFEQLEAMVETMVDLPALDRHEYLVTADYDALLLSYKKEMRHLCNTMEASRRHAASALGLADKNVYLESSKVHGHYLRVTQKNESKLRGAQGYTRVDNTRKHGVKFRDDALSAANTRYMELSEEYEKRQSALVCSIVNTTATYLDPIEYAAALIAKLDVFVSLAHVAVMRDYVRPELLPLGTGMIKMKESRHPVIEIQDDLEFIPNDVNLAREGGATLQLITGPNMGGKSTYIRQVGIVLLMGQMGGFVPCTEATFSVCDAILARVGASDSLSRGVSTFMLEMLESAAILRNATSNSFVIIDELGRGTSTYDGFGIAWAMASHITTRTRALCLFATHFHELTTLADRVPGVANLHVTADSFGGDGLTFLYKMRDGPCDRSFGIQVAQMAGFPEHVIQLAKRKAAELEDFEVGSVELKKMKQSTNDADGEAEESKSNLTTLTRFVQFDLNDQSSVEPLAKIVCDK